MPDTAFTPTDGPKIFPAGAQPEARADVWFSPDLAAISKHASDIYSIHFGSDGFHNVLDHVAGSSQYEVGLFAGQFEAMAILCAAQSLVLSHWVISRNTEDLLYNLDVMNIIHIKSVRAVMAQYGEIRLDSTGQKYRVKHIVSTLKAFIRQAFLAQKIPSTVPRAASATRWWLPVQRGDPRTRFILACKLAAFIKEKDIGLTPDPSYLENFILPQDHGRPPPWLISILPRREYDILYSLWKAFPKEEDFCTHFGKSTLKLLGLEFSTDVNTELHWKADWHDMLAAITDRWMFSDSIYVATLRKFFEVSDVSTWGDKVGSEAQLGTCNMTNGTLTLTSPADEANVVSSLAAAFPPKAIYHPGRDHDFKWVTNVPIRTYVEQWILKDRQPDYAPKKPKRAVNEDTKAVKRKRT